MEHDSSWRVDLQSVLNETNQLSISASESKKCDAKHNKKYKKKKEHNERTHHRKRSITVSTDTTTARDHELHMGELCDEEEKPEKVIESDRESCIDEKQKRNVRSRHHKPNRSRGKLKKNAKQSKSDTEADDYQGDAEMGLGEGDSDVDTVVNQVTGMETCNESISSFFDDSSHSESNAKEECCDGDDELTDVEGIKTLFPRLVPAGCSAASARHQRVSQTNSMPPRQKNHLAALVENNLSWTHNGVNKLPGLVARSIRSRSSRAARRKIKSFSTTMLPQTNPSADLLADDLATVVLAQPPDFSNFKIRVSSEIKRKIDQDHHDLDEGGSNDSKMARDSF